LIQRGKIDKKVIVLKKSLSECSSATKTLYVKVIQLKDMRADSLEVIILKQREIEKNLVAIQKSSLKTTEESKNSFLKHSCRRDFNNYSRSGLTRS
jgi:hypothetical protein